MAGFGVTLFPRSRLNYQTPPNKAEAWLGNTLFGPLPFAGSRFTIIIRLKVGMTAAQNLIDMP